MRDGGEGRVLHRCTPTDTVGAARPPHGVASDASCTGRSPCCACTLMWVRWRSLVPAHRACWCAVAQGPGLGLGSLVQAAAAAAAGCGGDVLWCAGHTSAHVHSGGQKGGGTLPRPPPTPSSPACSLASWCLLLRPPTLQRAACIARAPPPLLWHL